MRCYRCGNVLSENDFCTSCGADVERYKRIVRMSNALYNSGLEKARQRDLSGAADVLRRSMKLDKKNIKARNLLGLVYFEMGEVVQAMAEWVISKNIKPEKNLADEYIATLQSNANKLDMINQTIKKYNIALEYAKQGSEDLAIIQLKKVLSVNPNLIKGHQLLALLYIKREQYEKAKRTLRKALKIDVNNTLCKRYMNEIEILQKKVDPLNSNEDREPEKEALSGYDVIIPKGAKGYREGNPMANTVLIVLAGIVIGMLATYFLVAPAKVKSLNAEHNLEVKELNAKIDEANTNVDDLQRKIDTLKDEKESLNKDLKEANGANDEVLESYDNVINAMNLYVKQDFKGCAEALAAIENPKSLSPSLKKSYDDLKKESYAQAAVIAYNEACDKFYTATNRDQWKTAIDALNEVFVYDYQATNYYDTAEKLCLAYTNWYDVTVQDAPADAAKAKKKGINGITSVINRLTKLEGVNEAQIDIYRNYLADLTAKE